MFFLSKIAVIHFSGLTTTSGADPVSLERVLICTNVWGFALLILSNFYLLFHEMKYFGLDYTKLYHFHGIFKNGRREGGFERTPLYPLWIRHCTGTVLIVFQ